MRFFCTLALSLSATLASLAQDTVRLSLDSCLNYAYKHNTTLQSSRLDQENAKIAYDGAKLRFSPTVNASASQNWSFNDGNSSRNGNYGINAGLVLFGGLSNLNNLQQAKLSMEQSELKAEQNRNQISSQIIQAYLTVMMNQEKLQYEHEVLRYSEEQASEGELKWSVGRMLESDYLLLKANLSSAKANIDNTRLTIASNMLALQTLLNPESGIVVAPIYNMDKMTPQSLMSLDSVMQMAQRNMPDFRISEMNVELARYNVRMAQGNYMPTLSMNAGASYYEGKNGQVDNSGTLVSSGGVNSSVGLSLNVPILNQGNNRTQLKQSKINLQQAEIAHQQQTLDLRKEVETQYLTTQQAYNQYQSSEKLKEAYKASYDVYALKYSEGMVTTVELLQQQDKYLNALNSYLQNKYNYILDNEVLNIYIGQ